MLQNNDDFFCTNLDDALTPKDIVSQLDSYIVGQKEAKKKVAIAIRNRLRRNAVSDPDIKDEITPKNIMMIGPTGVGKTEIARRLAKLTNSPFIKVEATRFTEVGYVGRDVDSIIRDLADNAYLEIKNRKRKKFEEKAHKIAKEKILDIIVGVGKDNNLARESFEKKLNDGELDDKKIEISVQDLNNSIPSFAPIEGGGNMGAGGASIGIMNVGDVFGKMFGSAKNKKKKMTIKEAIKVIANEEIEAILDQEDLMKETVHLTSNCGIVFLDEIDKIAARTEVRGEVNREGVQRDLLPLVEGTVVNTKYGAIKTDYILFIASGAFYQTKPADLLPEFQGRFPVRVELNSLELSDMISILSDTKSSLLKQYQSLLKTEDVEIEFDISGIKKIAEFTIQVNKDVEDIGARRLHTVIEKLLEDISFDAPTISNGKIKIDNKYVEKKLSSVANKVNLLKFIV
ncbi:ATP-dependent protease ATPase subunit HslU [Anaplasmataceae bacterium AB001_6]|nr:ATP-dependent protease ATPase subunit HslU [Anaplasmataceae bacterium AB001_6]